MDAGATTPLALQCIPGLSVSFAATASPAAVTSPRGTTQLLLPRGLVHARQQEEQEASQTTPAPEQPTPTPPIVPDPEPPVLPYSVDSPLPLQWETGEAFRADAVLDEILAALMLTEAPVEPPGAPASPAADAAPAEVEAATAPTASFADPLRALEQEQVAGSDAGQSSSPLSHGEVEGSAASYGRPHIPSPAAEAPAPAATTAVTPSPSRAMSPSSVFDKAMDWGRRSIYGLPHPTGAADAPDEPLLTSDGGAAVSDDFVMVAHENLNAGAVIKALTSSQRQSGAPPSPKPQDAEAKADLPEIVSYPVHYHTALTTLHGLGHTDLELNLAVLEQSSGDLLTAIEVLGHNGS